MPNSRVKRERRQHKEAYELWAKMTDGRATEAAFAAVGKELGFRGRTIQNWYVSFNWRGRFESQLIYTPPKSLDEITALDDSPLSLDDYRKIIARMVRKFESLVEKGFLTPTINDFVKLCGLDLSILGVRTGGQGGVTVNVISAVPRPGEVENKPSFTPSVSVGLTKVKIGSTTATASTPAIIDIIPLDAGEEDDNI